MTDVSRERERAYAALSTHCKVPLALTPAEVEVRVAADGEPIRLAG